MSTPLRGIVRINRPVAIGPDATLILSGQEVREVQLNSTLGAYLVNAGKLFEDFITSKDGQMAFRHADYLTVDPDVPPLKPELGLDGKYYPVSFFSPEELEGNMPKWADIYKRLFK